MHSVSRDRLSPSHTASRHSVVINYRHRLANKSSPTTCANTEPVVGSLLHATSKQSAFSCIFRNPTYPALNYLVYRLIIITHSSFVGMCICASSSGRDLLRQVIAEATISLYLNSTDSYATTRHKQTYNAIHSYKSANKNCIKQPHGPNCLQSK